MISTFIFRLNLILRPSGGDIFIHMLRFMSCRQDEPRRFQTKCHSSISSGSCLREKQPRSGLVERHPFTCLPLLLPPPPAPLLQILEKQQIPSRGSTDTLQVVVAHRHRAAALLPLPPFIVCHLLAALRSASSDLLFFPSYLPLFSSFRTEEKRIKPVR